MEDGRRRKRRSKGRKTSRIRQYQTIFLLGCTKECRRV